MTTDSLLVTQPDANELAAGIGRVTEMAWEPPDDITFERWEAIGWTILRMVRSSTWWLGDWWRFGEHSYGERASQATPTGHALKTLQNAAWVADRIEPSRRRKELSFDHHSAVAALQPDQQDVVLDQAEGNDLSAKETRRVAREVKSGQPSTNGSEPADTRLSDDEVARLKAKAQQALRDRSDVTLAPGTLLLLCQEVERCRR